jgi:hypothetical protein
VVAPTGLRRYVRGSPHEGATAGTAPKAPDTLSTTNNTNTTTKAPDTLSTTNNTNTTTKAPDTLGWPRLAALLVARSSLLR